MTEKIEDGGPAFPHDEFIIKSRGYGPEFGLSKRDHFAGQALQGLCANPGGPFQASSLSGWTLVNCTLDQVAEEAYRLADAMLRARGGAA